MSSFPAWDGADRCTKGPQPGVVAFAAWCLEEYGGRGFFNLGIYNCRTVRGGKATSLHGEGRALDAGFPVGDIDGDDFLKRILAKPGELGIQAIIYERRIYSALSPKGRHYTGLVPHTDHLHVEFTWEAALKLNLTTCRQVLARKEYKPGSRSLDTGAEGLDVRWLQTKIGMRPSDIDGFFGPRTKTAVVAYEKSKIPMFPRLKADGIVGPITWVSLGVKPSF